MSDNMNGQGDSKRSGWLGKVVMISVVFFAVLILYVLFSPPWGSNFDTQELNYDVFIKLLEREKLVYNEDIPLIISSSGTVNGQYRNQDGNVVFFSTQIPVLDDEGYLFGLLQDKKVNYKAEDGSSPFFQLFLLNVVPILVLLAIIGVPIWLIVRKKR